MQLSIEQTKQWALHHALNIRSRACATLQESHETTTPSVELESPVLEQRREMGFLGERPDLLAGLVETRAVDGDVDERVAVKNFEDLLQAAQEIHANAAQNLNVCNRKR